MNEKQWENLQQFSAYKLPEKKNKITGFESFFISFSITLYLIFLIVGLTGK